MGMNNRPTHYPDRPAQSNLYPLALDAERRARAAYNTHQYSAYCPSAAGDHCDVCIYLYRTLVLASKVASQAANIDGMSFRRDVVAPSF